MGKYDHLFRKMETAKDIGGDFAERIGRGEHVLMLKRYGGKDSDQEMGTILEAEFEVVESSEYKPGELRGMAWWPEAAGWSGKYNEKRGKEFAVAVASCVGDALSVSEIGCKLIDDAQEYRGLMIGCRVTKGKPKKDDPTEFYDKVTWVTIPQTWEQVAENRAALDAKEPKALAPAPRTAAPTAARADAPAQKTAPEKTAAPVAVAGKKPSILDGYRRG